MRKRLHLHIGSPKTATSLVQRHFARSSVLPDMDIDYPVTGRPANGVAHHLLGHAIMAGNIDAALRMLEPELSGDACMLLSSESFTNCVASCRRFPAFMEFLQQLGTRFESIQVIIFVREASSFFESMYLHTIKATGLEISFSDYLTARGHWYSNLFSNLHKIRAQPSLARLDAYAFQPGSYSADWNEALGFDLAINTSRRVNPRLSLKSQAILKHYEGFCRQMGVATNRRIAMDKFSAHEPPFEEDVYDFCLYSPGMARKIADDALIHAKRHGMVEYLAAFDSFVPASSSNHVEIDYALLTQQDLVRARDFLQNP